MTHLNNSRFDVRKTHFLQIIIWLLDILWGKSQLFAQAERDVLRQRQASQLSGPATRASAAAADEEISSLEQTLEPGGKKSEDESVGLTFVSMCYITLFFWCVLLD